MQELKNQRDTLKSTVFLINAKLQQNAVTLNQLERQIDLKNQYCTQRDYLLENKRILEEERSVLQLTLQCLTEAKQNLTNGVYQPITNSLQKYAKQLLPTVKGFTIDADFNVSYETDGITRDYSSFSSGLKQLVDFALRLGLIDALFTKESPFIIIDDAFALLDQNYFELCKKLLNSVSKDKQIIYFTPHPSRSI